MTNKIAFIFPGQGSQKVGMGQDVAATYPEAAALFKQADQILGLPLSKLCWEGPADELNDTYNTQPAIFVTSLAILAALRATGYQIDPAFVAGHSFGEFTAYVAAGVLSFEAGLKLVRERGRLMKKAGELKPGKMAAILALSDEQVAEICQQASADTAWVQVANYNCPGQVVISGEEAGIDRAMELARAAKARRVQKLAVSIAAHSKLMAVISDEFAAAVTATPLNAPQIPIIANNTALPLETSIDIRTEMIEQLTASQLWTQAVQYMIGQGVTHFIELGAINVLNSMIKRIDRNVTRTTLADSAGISKFLEE